MPTLIAVYGSLKQGQSNHHYLEKARFLGQDKIHQIVLYDLGPYPGAKLSSSRGIDVELYEVDTPTLAKVDQLEGISRQNDEQGLYYRTPLKTRLGQAWVYIYNPPVGGRRVIRQGGWSSHGHN
ncbi:gamma-glutamylcyclotransferase family protein [Marinospirillum perlucidum]|uniref:gamma-glutamylcyclotransferase family protein n=1 Tax=Marinospirillum perlucidum TaxID=1982602 RepID=UPI000DF487B3|nr:gamma-glutamylcyclotransferase [Marinospirillum perlucidum]